MSPSSIFDVVEDHCPLPCEITGWPIAFFLGRVFPCVYFSTTVCNWIPKSTSIFPVQSRFNEDLFKKKTPTSPTNEAVHEYINDIVSTLGALQQNRTLRELTFSGDVDDMTVLASTLKVNTTLQRIESQGDVFTGHLELLFQALFFLGGAGGGKSAHFSYSRQQGTTGAVGFQTSQIFVAWIWSFNLMMFLVRFGVSTVKNGRHLRGLVE